MCQGSGDGADLRGYLETVVAKMNEFIAIKEDVRFCKMYGSIYTHMNMDMYVYAHIYTCNTSQYHNIYWNKSLRTHLWGVSLTSSRTHECILSHTCICRVTHTQVCVQVTGCQSWRAMAHIQITHIYMYMYKYTCIYLYMKVYL